MVAFYDNEKAGKIYMRAPAGAGGSEFDGPATDSDIAANPDAFARYRAGKKRAAEPAAPTTDERIAALQAEHETILAEVRAENAKLQAELDAARAALNPKPAD